MPIRADAADFRRYLLRLSKSPFVMFVLGFTLACRHTLADDTLRQNERQHEPAANNESEQPQQPIKSNADKDAVTFLEGMVAEYSAAIMRFPKSADSYVDRASALMSLGRLKEAEADLATAKRLAPNSERVIEQIGELKLAEKRFEEAIEHFDDAIERNPSGGTFFSRGVAKWELGRKSEALDDADEAIRRIEYDFQADLYFYTRATWLIDIHHYAAARDDIDRCIERDQAATLFIMRGKCNLELSQIAKAINDCSAAIWLDQQDGEAFFIRALAYRKLGKESLALTDEFTALTKSVNLAKP